MQISEIFPFTLALSPNTKNVLGEREQIVGMLTQGYNPPPRRGSVRKKRAPAASQTSNLQALAKAGTQSAFEGLVWRAGTKTWISAFAGMTALWGGNACHSWFFDSE